MDLDKWWLLVMSVLTTAVVAIKDLMDGEESTKGRVKHFQSECCICQLNRDREIQIHFSFFSPVQLTTARIEDQFAECDDQQLLRPPLA